MGLRPGSSLETDVVNMMRRILNVYLIQGPGLGEMYMAGILRKPSGDEKILVTVISSM